MKLNGRTVGYAMITPAQIGQAVSEYLVANPDVVEDAVLTFMDKQNQPIACVYNGIELPPLPKWDNEAYPYAAMSVSFDSDGNPKSAYLALMPREGILMSTGDGKPLALHLSVGDTYLSSSWYSYNAGAFVFSEPKETMLTNEGQQGRIMNASAIKWTNYDISDSTSGELFLAASDPVPVYDDSDANTGLPVVDLDEYYDDMVEDGAQHPCPEAMAEILERCVTQGMPCIFKMLFEDGYAASYLCNCDMIMDLDQNFMGVWFSFYVGKLADNFYLYKYTFLKLYEDDAWQYVVEYNG